MAICHLLEVAKKQITARGEAIVDALPDRGKVKQALDKQPGSTPTEATKRKIGLSRMLADIEKGLKQHFDGKLVDELLAAYQDTKHNFYVGGLRLSAVEGGRFARPLFGYWSRQRAGDIPGSINRWMQRSSRYGHRTSHGARLLIQYDCTFHGHYGSFTTFGTTAKPPGNIEQLPCSTVCPRWTSTRIAPYRIPTSKLATCWLGRASAAATGPSTAS